MNITKYILVSITTFATTSSAMATPVTLFSALPAGGRFSESSQPVQGSFVPQQLATGFNPGQDSIITGVTFFGFDGGVSLPPRILPDGSFYYPPPNPNVDKLFQLDFFVDANSDGVPDVDSIFRYDTTAVTGIATGFATTNANTEQFYRWDVSIPELSLEAETEHWVSVYGRSGTGGVGGTQTFLWAEAADDTGAWRFGPGAEWGLTNQSFAIELKGNAVPEPTALAVWVVAGLLAWIPWSFRKRLVP